MKYIALLTFSVLSVTVPAVMAQTGNRVSLVAPRAASSAPRSRPRPVAIVRRADPVVVTKSIIVRVSNLTVNTEPKAAVVLESVVKLPKPFKREAVADAEGTAFFDDLPPGKYNVTASKDDFQTEERENVVIKPKTGHGLSLDLKPITYKLKLKTNLSGGEIRFAPAINKGKDASGAIISQQLGNYCVVKIDKDGAAQVTDLAAGYYDIDIRPDSLDFAVKETGITLPDDLDSDDSAELQTFQVDLEKNRSTEIFSATAWVPSDWEMPAAWKLGKGMSVQNAEGIALPRNSRYRYYVDFQMVANVILKDKGTVGFVLRAQGPRDYHLLEISGPYGVQPNTATLYTVKDGKAQPVISATTVAFTPTLASSDGFRIIITGDSEGYFATIEDTGTGREYPLAKLKDPNKAYQKGAIGIAAGSRSDFVVNYFQICASRCPGP